MSLDAYLINKYPDHSIVNFDHTSLECQQYFLSSGYSPAIRIDQIDLLVYSVLCIPLAWRQTNPVIYRLTRKLYNSDQGYYVQAKSEREALSKMSDRFPGESFSVEVWL